MFDAAIQTKRLVEETLTSEDAVVTVSSEHECKYNEGIKKLDQLTSQIYAGLEPEGFV